MQSKLGEMGLISATSIQHVSDIVRLCFQGLEFKTKEEVNGA